MVGGRGGGNTVRLVKRRRNVRGRLGEGLRIVQGVGGGKKVAEKSYTEKCGTDAAAEGEALWFSVVENSMSRNGRPVMKGGGPWCGRKQPREGRSAMTSSYGGGEIERKEKCPTLLHGKISKEVLQLDQPISSGNWGACNLTILS